MALPQRDPNQPTQQPQQSPGRVTDLIIRINDELNQLGEIVSSSNLPQQDQAQFSQILNSFTNFVDNLGQAPNQGQPQAKPQPPMAGQGIVTPEMGGKMNVRQAM